jgi:predicted RNase H-like HicB family nuclease
VKRFVEVRFFRGDAYYVAECLALPVVSQARSLDDLAVNIREAVSLHLEGEDLDALGLAPHPVILATLELPVQDADNLA